MKTLTSLFVLMLAIGISAPVFAQAPAPQKKKMQWHKQGKRGQWLDLTKDQQKKMKQLRLNVMEQTLPLKNQLREKKAELRSLTTGENTDFNSAENTIDEMASLRAEIAKKRLESKEQMRNMLTDEQRLKFDSMGSHRKMGHSFRGRKHQHHPVK